MTENVENPLALCGVKAQPSDVSHALQLMESKGIPVIAPGGTTQCLAIPDGYAVSITSATFQKDDTFKDGSSGQLCFKAKALAVLGKGLGVKWNPKEFRRLDDQKDPNYCSMIVVGEYRDYTGEMIPVVGTRSLDLREGSAQLLKKNGDPLSVKQINTERSNIQSRCETMAKSRALADGCVTRTLTHDDIGKAYVMAKVYRRDPVDPDEARSALYGDPPPSDEPRVVDAQVTTTKPTGSSDGFVLPSAKFIPEADRGKVPGAASTEALQAMLTKVTERMDANPEMDDATRAKGEAWQSLLLAELNHRKPPQDDGAFDFGDGS